MEIFDFDVVLPPVDLPMTYRSVLYLYVTASGANTVDSPELIMPAWSDGATEEK